MGPPAPQMGRYLHYVSNWSFWLKCHAEAVLPDRPCCLPAYPGPAVCQPIQALLPASQARPCCLPAKPGPAACQQSQALLPASLSMPCCLPAYPGHAACQPIQVLPACQSSQAQLPASLSRPCCLPAKPGPTACQPVQAPLLPARDESSCSGRKIGAPTKRFRTQYSLTKVPGQNIPLKKFPSQNVSKTKLCCR